PRRLGSMSWSWVGVAPFFLFALLFLILPTGYLPVGSFQDAAGKFTLANIGNLFTPSILSAYRISIEVSLASAITGAIAGFFLAYAVVLGRLPAWIRPTLMTFSGVASNFAGIPLAFAFLATLGRTGLVTTLLIKYAGFNIYSTGFNLLSFSGLTLTYLYFQIPLMVLILTPALDGHPRYDAPPLRQLFRRGGDRLWAHRIVTQHRHHPPLRADPRRRPPRPESRLRAGARHDHHHRPLQCRLYL